MKRFGGHSMVAPLQMVLVRRPDAAFAVADAEKWHYAERPHLASAQQEHDAFVNCLHQSGVEVVTHDIPLPHHADAIFVHDPVLITDRGAIILRMGKALRSGEEAAMVEMCGKLDIPIQATLQEEARAEGGDLLWIDERTLAVGQGFRTNAAGLRQLRQALAGQEVEIVPVELPYHQGPDACLHLMSLISIVDRDLAVVYLPLLPVPFWRYLQERGFRLVEVPESEFATMGSNVLALAPGQCLMLFRQVKKGY
jgi:N-dimethylarginine dimethylaminohydrolase